MTILLFGIIVHQLRTCIDSRLQLCYVYVIRAKKLDDTTMKAKLSTIKNRRTESQAFFLIFKLPLLLITPILGFIIEFLYELPFMLLCLLDSRLRK